MSARLRHVPNVVRFRLARLTAFVIGRCPRRIPDLGLQPWPAARRLLALPIYGSCCADWGYAESCRSRHDISHGRVDRLTSSPVQPCS